MEVFVISGQSILDVAVQHSGSVEACFDLAIRNNLSLTGGLVPGVALNLGQPLNNDIVNFFRANKKQPASYMGTIQPAGIGYWAIEIDFVVS